MSADAEPSVYSLLADGTTIGIRPARPDDLDAVREMHEKMSPENLYLRFFSLSPRAAEWEARRLCREPAPNHAALLALLDGELIGCGSYECDDSPSRSAEVALAVADDMHRRGVGTLLLEHLVSLARRRGLHAFTAETLSENAPMLRVFAEAGLQAHRTLADGVYSLTFPLPTGEADAALGSYRDVVAERERSADVASLRHILAPASVAVIGASRRPGSVGRVILRNIVSGGFPGPVYAVNPAATELDGVPCVPSAAALPGDVDLAVIATPAAAVAGIAEECGRRGVKGLVVLASGLERRGPRGAAGHLPPPWHADGRADQLRGGRHQRPARRDVRGPPCPAGKRWPGAGVDRRRRLRPGRAPVADRRRDLLPRLARRQGRRGRHRHAAVVGVRPGDQAGPAIPRVDHEPAQVRPHRPPGRPQLCRS